MKDLILPKITPNTPLDADDIKNNSMFLAMLGIADDGINLQLQPGVAFNGTKNINSVLYTDKTGRLILTDPGNLFWDMKEVVNDIDERGSVRLFGYNSLGTVKVSSAGLISYNSQSSVISKESDIQQLVFYMPEAHPSTRTYTIAEGTEKAKFWLTCERSVDSLYITLISEIQGKEATTITDVINVEAPDAIELNLFSNNIPRNSNRFHIALIKHDTYDYQKSRYYQITPK